MTVGELKQLLSYYDPATPVVATWEGVYRMLHHRGVWLEGSEPVLVIDAQDEDGYYGHNTWKPREGTSRLHPRKAKESQP